MSDFMAEIHAHEKAVAEALEQDKPLQGQIVKGRIFRVQVADSYAWYEVTAISPRNIHVKWREDLSWDYQDAVLGAGGSFPRRSIQPLIERQDALARIFG